MIVKDILLSYKWKYDNTTLTDHFHVFKFSRFKIKDDSMFSVVLMFRNNKGLYIWVFFIIGTYLYAILWLYKNVYSIRKFQLNRTCVMRLNDWKYNIIITSHINSTLINRIIPKHFFFFLNLSSYFVSKITLFHYNMI